MHNRIEKVRRLLDKQKLDAFLITSVANISYLSGYTNFSVEEREAYLVITAKEAYVLTDGRYTTAIHALGHLKLIELSSTNQFQKVFTELCEQNNIQTLGIEEKDITVYELKKIQEIVLDTKPAELHTLRIQKEHKEIEKIAEACRIGDLGFNFILTKIKPGITEKELAKKLKIFILEQGAELSFDPIVAFGSNAAIPHHQTGDKRLATSDLVLLDFGVKVESYCSDMTRTLFFGKATDEQKRIYNVVREAQQKAIDYIHLHLADNRQLITDNSGAKEIIASNIDAAARNHILSQDYPSIPHSLGHGIGLQVHEAPTLSPVSKQILTEGMVFSIEPGIYIPNYGGVRIEDLFVIENNTLKQLTDTPRDFKEL